MRKKFGVLTFGRGAPTERELKSATYQVPMRLSEITADVYRERVEQACEFLDGHSREMIATLEEEMRKAADKMDFEKAAELRNMLDDLRRTTRRDRSHGRGPGAGRRASTFARAAGDGMLRYLEHLHDACRGLDGLLPQWRARQRQLPPLSHSHRGRAG